MTRSARSNRIVELDGLYRQLDNLQAEVDYNTRVRNAKMVKSARQDITRVRYAIRDLERGINAQYN